MRVCIPARWGAHRFPGKLARPWRDTTVLEAVCATARAADCGPVTLLADDERLLALGRRAGVQCLLLPDPAASGSARVALALARGLLGDPSQLLNLQGDAVGASPLCLRAAAEALGDDPDSSLGTVAVRAPRAAAGGRTTVALDARGRALYFSRLPLPADRDHAGAPLLLHVGVYAYRPEALLRMMARPEGPLESAERLEQLRWLEQGERVAVRVLDGAPSLADAVDHPSDL